mgnify:FL=1|tara:strand:+ start:1224 stop:2627 length:1404 start_codon:yes stop_codon:yes gene_type:complete
MKKKSFTIPFKSNFFKEQDPFHLVIVFFVIFFGTAIFFSIPTFYDYKKYNQKIENTINKEFKIKLQNLESISFRFIPSPHLLIKKADLKIKEDELNPISNLENIKVFISLTDLYRDDIFKIKKIVIKKANLYLNKNSGLNFIKNLKKNIVNDLRINNSTLFFKDDKEEIVFISKIKNLIYKIDLINNKKILLINGNIFDSNYNLNYFIDYEDPNTQNLNINLKNPNIVFNNKLTVDIFSSKSKQEGELLTKFLNNKNNFKYTIVDKEINFVKQKVNNTNFDLLGSIAFQPFYFDLSFNLKKNDLIDVENIIFQIFSNKDMKFKNLSGKLNINFEDIDNKIINRGLLNLSFENSRILTKNFKLNLEDFGSLEIVDYEYLTNINQVLQMKVKANVINKEKFNRFLFSYKKNIINSDYIFFTYQYNIDSGNSFISTISNKGFLNNNEFYKFKNLQQLKNLLRNDNLLSLD